jgi:hypothetical protein
VGIDLVDINLTLHRSLPKNDSMISFWRRVAASKAGGTVRTLLAKPHAGSVVAAGVGLVALVLVTAGFALGFDWVRSWRVIGFPAALPPFSDLHVVTDNAERCAADGIGAYPYLHSKCDLWHQIYNYPPIWMLLGDLGIGSRHTALLAMLIELPALALMALLLRGYTVGCGLIALPLVLSPSVVLGFERGNIDILEWVLVCSAALLFSEHRMIRAGAALLLLWLAVAIKFLAVYCCTLFIRLRPMSVTVSLLLVAFTLLYLYSLADVLPFIRTITPASPYVSYGYIIVFDRLEFLYGPRLGLDLAGLTRSWIPIAAVVLVLLAAAASAITIWRRGRALGRLSEGSAGVAFLFGSGIYCGSFLLLGTNFTYRLMFLLLCLPQLFEWVEGRGGADAGSQRLAYLLLGSCLISMWLKFHPEKTLHVNQLTDWILFGVLTMLLALNALHVLASLLEQRAGRRAIVTSP